MITALIHYKEWVEASHPALDGNYVKRSRVVEVAKLSDLNDMFEYIEKIEITCTCTPDETTGWIEDTGQKCCNTCGKSQGKLK